MLLILYYRGLLNNEVLHTIHIQYKIPLFFEIRTHGNEIEISTPARIQPWDNFNLRHIQSRFANELQRYICRVLNYAQSIDIISNFNSTENCDRYDTDRVNAVYEILQMMQEIEIGFYDVTLCKPVLNRLVPDECPCLKLDGGTTLIFMVAKHLSNLTQQVKMVEEVRNMRLNEKGCQSMTLSELNAYTQNTVDFFALMRNFPDQIKGYQIKLCVFFNRTLNNSY
ncbi:hypothetical protein ACTXT7_005634 [Hymenolepis weldensis]